MKTRECTVDGMGARNEIEWVEWECTVDGMGARNEIEWVEWECTVDGMGARNEIEWVEKGHCRPITELNNNWTALYMFYLFFM